MAEVFYNVKVKSNVEDSNPELLKVLAREIIAGVALSTDQNLNIQDIAVTAIESVETVVTKTDCMPDEEISQLG